MAFVYVASPYTHQDKEVMHVRFLAAMRLTAWFLERKIWCYSPIVHCHQLAVAYNLPRDRAFWTEYNDAMQSKAIETAVLAIEGWRESVGVQDEIERALEELRQRVLVYTPDGESYKIEKYQNLKA